MRMASGMANRIQGMYGNRRGIATTDDLVQSKMEIQKITNEVSETEDEDEEDSKTVILLSLPHLLHLNI